MATVLRLAGGVIPVAARRKLWKVIPTFVVRRLAYLRLRRSLPTMPTTFNEKIRYRMAYDRRPFLRHFTDKVAVRAFVTERIGQDHLPHHYGVFRRGTEIDWDTLPREFVLKATHGSGGVIVVWDGAPRHSLPVAGTKASWENRVIHPDDFDPTTVSRLADGWIRLRHELRDANPQWAYRSILPRIIAEELLLEPERQLPKDYKFYMFDGTCELVFVADSRFEAKQGSFFSPDWRLLPVSLINWLQPEQPAPRPSNLQQMLRVAEALSCGVDFVRVDLYDLGDRVVFGELTLYPSAGHSGWEPPDFDGTLGAFWKLPSTDRLTNGHGSRTSSAP